MLSKIKVFLYALTYATGRLLGLKVNLGPACLYLYVGREEPNVVRFAVDAEFIYSPAYPMLDVTVEVGVIKVELSLTRSSSG